jgi:hypothetical protein
MRRVTLVLLLALSGPLGCSDEAPAGTTSGDASTSDARAVGSDAGAPDVTTDVAASTSSEPAPIECFAGMPRTQDEILNACWPATVAALRKTVVLPGGYKLGDPLPAPPPP